jgi:DNA-binding response OmpR family regulator
MSGARPYVLVVDDEAPLRELVVVTLSRLFACEEAPDGEAALDRLRATRPALVLLDAMLPGRSGLDVLREMRSDEELKDVPVLMLSAWQSEADVEAALGAGANAFLGKPFDPDDLVTAVRSLTGSAG